MVVTDEQPTQRLGEAASPPDWWYRVVLDGIGTRSGSIAATPFPDRAEALAAFDRAVATFAADIAAGQLRVSVLTEAAWTERGRRG